MFRPAVLVLIMAGLTLACATVEVSDLRQLPSADLNSGLGYELLLTAIEAMQQDIMETRAQVREQRQLLEEVRGEIDRKQQSVESKVQVVLKRSLVELNQKIQTSLRKDSASAEQMQLRIEQFENRTEQTLSQHKQSFKQELEDLDKRMQQSITKLQSIAPSTERASFRTSISNRTTPADNRVYGSCQEVQTREIVNIRPPKSGLPSFKVLCEQNNWGAWILIHYRFDGSVNFDRNWSDYRNGFGRLDSEFWLGLEKMHRLTSSDSYELLIVMRRKDGSDSYAHYQRIVVGSSAEKYKLQLSGFYRGSVLDSMASSNGMAFSTPDADNDQAPDANCAQGYSSGWWFNQCFNANLNGLYSPGKLDDAMQWNGFGDKEGLLAAEMMIRPSPPMNLDGPMMPHCGSN
ncbi:hypothetical protein pipiens_014281 [Culex pipiens pipiens]|uniref:Fibrinogen C-terminal domain-containing protein n=1 Tax=Culex pipiens pipiens TaxID=38569 RepID=A0ABD1CXH8_CULPP